VPIAGYCHECGDWVYVTADWSCPKGHSAVVVNGWYDTGSGAHVTPPVTAPEGVGKPIESGNRPVSASGTRTGFLIDLLAVFGQSRAYSAAWGSDTDMTIASNPVDPMWGSGKTRAEYSAALKVAEADRVVHFWEVLKEHATGIPLKSGESESYVPEDIGKRAAVGPGSAPWEWGYGTTRKVVEEVAARHGFTVRLVLTRDAAVW
jgi:hypothetical protein